MSHTLIKPNAKLASQWKKFRDETKVLSERDMARKGKQHLNKLTKSNIGATVHGIIQSGVASSSLSTHHKQRLATSSTLPASSTQFPQAQIKHERRREQIFTGKDESSLMSPLTDKSPRVNRYDLTDPVLTPLSSAALEHMQSAVPVSL